MARPSNREARQADIKAALLRTSRRYEGEALLAPSAADLAESLGRTTGYIYREGDYQATLERLSGLTVIHNGLVLAGDVEQNVQKAPQLEMADLSKLSPNEIVRLVGRLTTELASKITAD
jgi:hypothetical protein